MDLHIFARICVKKKSGRVCMNLEEFASKSWDICFFCSYGETSFKNLCQKNFGDICMYLHEFASKSGGICTNLLQNPGIFAYICTNLCQKKIWSSLHEFVSKTKSGRVCKNLHQYLGVFA